MVNLIELAINTILIAEDTLFLAQYFPNLFAEALVSINASICLGNAEFDKFLFLRF